MRISVVIPVRNEQDSIRALLDGLLEQTRPPDEIVITNGGSTDDTAAIIGEYIQRGAPIQLINSSPALPGRGRNLAAAQASGDWLAFIDAGIRPSPDWLQELEAPTELRNVDVVYGSYEPRTYNLFTECAAIAYVSPPAEVDGVLLRTKSIASSLMRRSVWQSVGGFPEHLRSAEDLLFMRKIDEAGFAVIYAGKATVSWELQPTFGQTFKRFVTYARNNIRAGLWRQWQAPIFTRYGLLLLSALPTFLLGFRWLLIPVVLWLLMLAARSTVAMRRNRRAYPASAGRWLQRLLVLIPLLAVLDAALMAGSLEWLLKDKFKLGGPSERVAHGT